MGDDMLNQFLVAYFETPEKQDAARKFLTSLQNALNNEGDGLSYKGSTTISDTYFYRSGIASICMETQFNSTFLQTATPSIIVNDIFPIISSEDKNLIPMVPKFVSGVSYPVSLTISGKTEFYDYKSPDDVDISSLIEENMSEIANSIGLYDGNISVDMIFPLRTILMQKADAKGYSHYDKESGKKYVNIPIAYYGGGLNLSTVSIETQGSQSVSDGVEIDLLDTYLNLKGSSNADTLIERMKGLMLKTVPVVMGFEPFEFNFVCDGYLYGMSPQIADLIENAKGE